ncbi:MAG: c-type cytochrome domain-containing protein [Chloroflexota bacterium]
MIPDRGVMFRSFLLIVFVSLLYAGCTHEANLSDFPEICFTGEVLPVFQNNCAMPGCHDGSGESDFSLGSYSEIRTGVTPGNAEKSEVYRVIISKWGQRMPPDKPLSMEDRVKIRVWIDQGAAETTCSAKGGSDAAAYVGRACFSRDILPVIVSHCATPGCHDATAHKEGYIFTSYATIRNAVSPGNASSSRIYRSVIANSEDKMPPSGSPQLTTAQVDSIRNWISYGALNENCGENCDTINPVTFSGSIWPVIQTTCSGCHSGNAPSGNVSLSAYPGVAAAASNGLLMKSLSGAGVTMMPPSGTLSSCRIRQFDTWVKNGFPNN